MTREFPTREWLPLAAVVLTAVAVGLLTWTPGPGPGIIVLVAVVLLARGVPRALAHRRELSGTPSVAPPGRSGDRLAAESEAALTGDILSAFEAIENAVAPAARAKAAARMTPEFAARWRAGLVEWTQARASGERPRAAIIEWSLITRTRGEREAAWVRFVLAGSGAGDLAERNWIEHWVFVRTASEPAVTACSSCGAAIVEGAPAECTHCGTPLRQVRSRWLVDSIAAATPRSGWMPERRRHVRMPALLDMYR